MQYKQQIYVRKTVLQKFSIKNNKSNSNITISKILHLPFDMLCYLLEIIMAPCKIHLQSAITFRVPVVQKRAPGKTKSDCVM